MTGTEDDNLNIAHFYLQKPTVDNRGRSIVEVAQCVQYYRKNQTADNSFGCYRLIRPTKASTLER
ncbi:hypothetical protein [Cupriavidus sp. AcVe19-6a]|uniref:hypothetical protein n=1 Tax=Cupriavidus sp. AcVe19-6a TaxID=2821358 RepID=UPI001AE51C65|nr:hypothetical protein [Cupriavidus sp. AcVe19-6a]MBP0639438.1 hypothetical protein [Cupriavidus sp. AcVe19-6a]